MKKVLICILISVTLIFQTACQDFRFCEKLDCKNYSEFENFLINDAVFYSYRNGTKLYSIPYYCFVVPNYEVIINKILNYWRERGLIGDYELESFFMWVGYLESEVREARRAFSQNVLPVGPSSQYGLPSLYVEVKIKTEKSKDFVNLISIELKNFNKFYEYGSGVNEYNPTFNYYFLDFFNLFESKYVEEHKEGTWVEKAVDLNLPLEIQIIQPNKNSNEAHFFSLTPSSYSFEESADYGEDPLNAKNLENYLYFYNKILKKPYIERYAGENVNVNNYLIPQEILLEWLYDFINNDVHLYAIEPSAEASHIGRTVKIK